METIELTLSGDALATLPALKDQPGLGRAIARRMDYENQLTVARIQKFHLSGPTTDSSLSVRTNRLRGSVNATRALVLADGVQSSIGSNVEYALIHEVGGTTAPHIIEPRNGKCLAFGGKCYRRVHHPGSKIPARSPFGHGIADRANDYGAGLSTAVLNFWRRTQ